MSWCERLLRSIALRLVLALSFLLLALFVRELLLAVARAVIELPQGPPGIWLGPPGAGADGAAALYALVAAFLTILLGAAAYRGYVRSIEDRHPLELSLHRLWQELSIGILVGGAFVVLMVLPIWLAGGYRVVGWGTASATVIALSIAAGAGFMEEVLVRGVLLRLLEERLGTVLALGATSLAFGALHLGNPGATWWGALDVAISAGLVLGLAYVLTRRLWLPIGIHFGFNFFEGGVLGLRVSGFDHPGLIEAEVSGPPLLTGGSFGPEASLQTLFLGLALAIGLGWMSSSRHRFRTLRRSVATTPYSEKQRAAKLEA